MMVPPPPTTTTTTTTRRREKKNGGGYGEDLRRALLESRTADETERDVNLRMLMHLRARRPEFEETAEAFLREAREGDGGRLPKRVDVNGVEREMTMQEMEAVFFGGDIHGRLKKSLPNERDVGLLSRNDVLQRGRGAMRKAKGLPNRRECVKFIGKKKNPLSVVARRGRLMNAATERRWNEFDAGETEFTSKCSDVYFGRRFECQRTIHAHRDACYCAVYNSKGDKWVTGSDDWLVKIWSARNGRLLASCRGHTEPITIVSICPRDYLIASGSIDKDVRTWKLETGEPVSVLRGHFLPITVVIFNPAKPWILASASQDGTMRLWHAYKHSGEQSAAVADVHAMVSEKNDNENANGNNNNDTNNPPEGQQQRRQQQNRGGRLPRTQLTQVITLSFNCDGTAVCGGTDTCHPSSSRLFCYDFDLSKIKEESRGEAPPLDSLSAYDLSNFYDRKIDVLDPLQLVHHMSRVDVTKFSNTDARIFISGSADGYIMCWQLPPKPKSDDRIKLKKGNRMRDELLCRLWVKKSQCSLENKSPEVVQAVWTKDDKHVIVTFANSEYPLDWPTVEFFQSHSGTPERNYEIITQTKKIVTLAPHPFDPQIFLTGSYDGHIVMWRIDGSISSSHDNNFLMVPWRTGGSISSIRTFSPQFENADFQIVELHWNPDGLSFVAADTKGNCYLFGIGDNKRYLTQKRQQYFSVEFIPESAIARDEHGVARVYQDPRADSVYGETLFEHYGFESEVLCDQMGDPYSVEFMDAFKKGENLENFFSAIPPNPSEREFEGAWNRLDGCQHSSSLQLMISHRYDESPGQFFIEDPILDNDDEANEPDDVERDPDITISDDEADDYENENDDFNVEPEDLAELEDSGNANDDDSDDDDWGTNNRRRTRRRRADNRARIEAARNRRQLRRSARRSYAESETDSEEEEVYESDLDEEDEDEDARPRTRRRRNNQQLSSESEEEEEEEEERKDAGEGEEHRSTRLTFVMGPVKRSEQCFSWLSREFQGYGCYVPQLGDSVMYIPQGHEEFFDALNDTVSYRVWDDKADVRFCEPCVVSNLRYIINASTGSTVTDAPNETICELMLRFADPRSANFGETFSLKLPRLSVPDFIVCMDRFIAARDKKWKANDQNVFCLWDWEIEDEQHPGCFGRWWHGEISSVVKNEGRWRGSPWNNLRITYSNQANESVTHCFWELFDAEDKVRWRRAAEARQRNRASDCLLGPALSTEVTRALTQKVEKLIANDRFLAYVTDASCDDVYLREAIGVNANYCKIVPLPMSLERIKRRLKGRYYRQIDAYKSDADLILSNATLFHGEGSGFEAVAKEIREELLKDIDENDFVADTHEIHLNFPSYGVIKREMKEDAKNEEEEKQEEKEEEKEEKEEEEREEETPTLSPPVTRTRRDGNTTEPTRRTTRASALTMADASVHPTRQRSSRRRNR